MVFEKDTFEEQDKGIDFTVKKVKKFIDMISTM